MSARPPCWQVYLLVIAWGKSLTNVSSGSAVLQSENTFNHSANRKVIMKHRPSSSSLSEARVQAGVDSLCVGFGIHAIMRHSSTLAWASLAGLMETLPPEHSMESCIDLLGVETAACCTLARGVTVSTTFCTGQIWWNGNINPISKLPTSIQTMSVTPERPAEVANRCATKLQHPSTACLSLLETQSPTESSTLEPKNSERVHGWVERGNAQTSIPSARCCTMLMDAITDNISRAGGVDSDAGPNATYYDSLMVH